MSTATTNGRAPATLPATAALTKDEASANPSCTTRASAAAPGPAATPTPVVAKTTTSSAAAPAVGVKVHEDPLAPTAIPLVHPSPDEKKATAHHPAAGDHEAHPSKPAIHPTAPIAVAASASHSSTSAATAAPAAAGAGAIPYVKHHYALRENLSGLLWTLTTSKSWKLVCEEFPIQATAHKFSVVGKHDLQESLTKKGMQFRDEAMIFELCNPQIAANVLAEHLALSAVLPCRVSVTAKYGEDGCAVNLFLPTGLLSACFERPQHEGTDQPSKNLYKFQELAENVTSTLKEIAKKAASK